MTAIGVFRDDYYDPTAILPEGQYNAGPTTSTVAAAAILTGARKNVIDISAQAANINVTTDTAANIVAQVLQAIQSIVGSPVPDVVGMSFLVRVINGNATYTVTLVGGAGVTVTGTAVVAVSSYRDYLVTVASDGAVTFQNIGAGTP